jgi:hypothetical protein
LENEWFENTSGVDIQKLTIDRHNHSAYSGS